MALRHLLLAALASQTYGQNDNDKSSKKDPYAPVTVECPKDLAVRPASHGLSDAEKSWRANRSKQIIPALRKYLDNAQITDFDVGAYIKMLNDTFVPTVGLSISGGGSQSGIGGLGIWKAFDGRVDESVRAGTGGLTQVLMYLTGLSGGGAITVGTIAANDFGTTDQIREGSNFTMSWSAGPTGNSTSFFSSIFEIVGGKAEAGYPVSVADTFGQFFGSWLPGDKTYSLYSDLAKEHSVLSAGQGPLPIIVLAEVVPGVSPEIGGIMFPGQNATNGFNLTSYEVTPFEFGSWLGGRVQAFVPTAYMGSKMDDGKPQDAKTCVAGFDQFSFIQGATTDAYNAYFIEQFYGIPTFAKRAVEGRQDVKSGQQASSADSDSIPIPDDQKDSLTVELVNMTASIFGTTFNESIWVTVPNPFENYDDEMKGVEELLLCDGSMTGETNPIRPLIIPARGVEFVIVYEASSDADYAWSNGTNLINTALSAKQGDIPFPPIPDINTLINKNMTRQPTFFGCPSTNSSTAPEYPIVLYLPNSPWTAYSNFSYQKDSFTDSQLDLTIENAFQLATWGNSFEDEKWPACIACATIAGTLGKMGMELPDECRECFDRHCWDGTMSEEAVDLERAFDLPLRLQPGLDFAEWDATVWAVAEGGNDDGSGGGGDQEGSGNTQQGDGSKGNSKSQAEGRLRFRNEALGLVGLAVAVVVSL